MKIERIGRDGGGAARNVERLAELFPNVVTEVCRDGRTVRTVDFDALRRELGQAAVEGEMRYSFTWPDKDKAVIAANEPADAALRPQVERSSGRSGTPGAFDSANVYIEGDNLTALKLLQETYLGRVKMIYIDPPTTRGTTSFTGTGLRSARRSTCKRRAQWAKGASASSRTPRRTAAFTPIGST